MLNFSDHRRATACKIWLARAVFISGLTALLYYLQGPGFELITKDGANIKLKDFKWFVEASRTLLEGTSHNLYTKERALSLMRHVSGIEGQSTMQVSLTPAGLLLFLPFAILESLNGALAFAFWNACSVGVLGAAAAQCLRGAYRDRVKIAILAAVSLFSASAWTNILHGQTALLQAAALSFLVSRIGDGEKRVNFSTAELLAYLILMAKPQTFVMGGLLILCSRDPARLKAAVVLGASAAIIGFLLIGRSWPLDYLQLLSTYTSEAPEPFADGMQRGLMNTFSTAFSAWLPQRALLLFSTAALAVCQALLILAAALGKGVLVRRPLTILRSSIAAYLLLSPHLYAYEELLLIPAVLSLRKARLTNARWAGMLLLVGLSVNIDLVRAEIPTTVLWLAKALLLFLVIRASRDVRGPTGAVSAGAVLKVDSE